VTGAAATRAAPPPGGLAATGAGRRELVLCWYLPLLAGLVPVLVTGFAASALANRLAFAAWAVAVAAAYAALLRVSWDLGWANRFIAAAALATLALGFGAFAALVERHQEIFDLGFRAVLPAVHHPLLTRPAAPLAVALALAAAGAGCLLLPRRGGRRP
jgi:hypothetical protein